MEQQIDNRADESEVIRNNEQFKEQLHEFDEEPPIENDLVMVDEDAHMDYESDAEDRNEEQRNVNADDVEIHNEAERNGPEEEGEVRNEEQGNGPEEEIQQARDEIAGLQQQLRQARQAVLDFRMVINELESRERCETRKFDGRIENPDELFMPCAFCRRRGDHCSDSCLVFRFTRERKQLVNRAQLCTMCFDYNCSRGRRCRKRNTRCYYCGRCGHNSALCTLPEKSIRINDELELLKRRYNDAFVRVLRFERKLRRRGVDM
ncbi:hypothetical protein TELCIR_13639 [Teladorsagia circumcincta]|uniref:CCHC-type domain-containing protein n=1 Tax=Teladorsagia circumcincta TaxID=45464 RepID=A0A2G9U374_TELCI|nr:hypothetical protein TELCIR_13639 [Teladorsagia circumcincta]